MDKINYANLADLISGGSSDPYSGGWDSGMSSAAATESQGGGGNGHQNNHQNDEKDGKCCGCQLGSSSGASCSSNSPQSSSTGASTNDTKVAEKEEWMQILEALETVGEEEMLKKLEECILTGQASNYGGPTMGGRNR
jgi:hypothetical protein